MTLRVPVHRKTAPGPGSGPGAPARGLLLVPHGGLHGHLRVRDHRRRHRHGDEFLVGAGKREGTYRVEITREGFTSFVQSNVDVGHDGCHVVGVTLRAELTRIP